MTRRRPESARTAERKAASKAQRPEYIVGCLAEPTDNDLTGTRIGEYEIVSRLGVGGMGIVYEGRQPLIGKRVAVKVLLPQLSADRELVERFITEARAVNEIGHRGIVDIFSFGQLPTGQAYFVMEYLHGLAFDQLITQRAPIPPAEALWWIEEVCEALHGAHEAGIIHRDIKPSNLFLVDTGRGRPYVKLLDFGIAKLGAIKGEATPQTRMSMVIGTPEYMSPEQARGLAISPATDVYALGCVLFEMLTGKRVFKGENGQQTMFMHVELEPPKLSEYVPDASPELQQLLLWTLEKDPLARPESAEELRIHLSEVRGALPAITVEPRPSPARSTSRSSSSLAPVPRSVPVATGNQFPADEPATAVMKSVKAVAAVVPKPAVQERTGPMPAVVVDEEESPKGFIALMIVLAVALCVAGGLVYGRYQDSKGEPVPQVPAEVAKPAPVKISKPVEKKPLAGISSEAISKRIEKLEKRLTEKEAASGDRDRPGRQMMGEAKALAEHADTEPRRRELWKFLDEVQRQLDSAM
jgi:serine/threonine protein kinase